MTQPALLGSVRDLLAACLCFAFIALVLISLFAGPARAGEESVLRRGDAVVSGYSGAKLRGGVPANVAPVDHTFIDTTGAVARVFDLSNLGGGANGQIANAPMKFSITAGDIGQVFGVALDSDSANRTPNIYLSATSLYGLQVVSKGGERLVKGEAGAKWMDGQFGTGKGGGPGSVWKIDGTSGSVSLFATIKRDGRENAGPGLGAIAYDAATNHLFVTDLETGLIHRLGMDGSDKGAFDHGVTARGKAGLATVAYEAKRRLDIASPSFKVEDAATWGYADARRRVFAVAVQDRRLYYSVAEGPVIWSVGIAPDGTFGDDARLEIDVTGTPASNLITGIAFDGPRTMYLTQRGEIAGSYDYSLFAKPQTSIVLRYTWDEGANAWSDGFDETPIGLAPPHRSTLGGLALSYGYGPSGTIDYGRCRETLWTTGEHLRESEDQSLTGARNVGGLQGNAKTLASSSYVSQPTKGSIALTGDYRNIIESGNDAPNAAWFVDYDDRFDDEDTYGHVGTIAVFNPCDQRQAAEPKLPDLPKPFPASGVPGVYIDKRCHPGPIGSKIRCVISVYSVGIATPEAPVTFSDFSTILAGPGAGGPIAIASAAPDGADWICSATPTASFSCALPASGLVPGKPRSVTVFVDTAGLVASGNYGFRNCAALGAPNSGVACDEGATEITVVKKAPASCMPGAACTFEVAITNSGTSPFSGDVLLTDHMFQDGGGAAVAAPITAIAPALACAPAPAALPFSCVAPMTLAPGEIKGFAITVTMPAAPANYWARNCIAVSAPGVPAPALPPGPDAGATTSCAWVPVGAPPPLSNLRLEKTALTCDKLDPMTVRCDYEIAIKNDGPSDYNGPVAFKETLPPAGVLAPVPAPWGCVAGNCSTAGAVLIPAGGQLTVPVSVDIPRVPLEAAKCWAPNKAEIIVPVGGNSNFNAADDADTATGDAALIRFDEGGPAELVLCDPTNLKVSKVAEGECGEGSACTYKVTVTNMGPDPFTGTLKVRDTFSPAPVSVEFPTPGWGCVPAGAGFECSRPNTDFKMGESVSFKVVAKPGDAGRCVLKNTARLTAPAANTRWNLDPSDDSASAEAKIKSKRCDAPTADPLPPPLKLCADGSIMPRSGVCPCGPGTRRNRITGACVPVCIPGPHETLTSSGQCACKPGYRRRGDFCVKPQVCDPGANEHRDRKGRCVCDEGSSRNKFGRCVKPEIKECTSGPNEHRDRAGQCVCDAGTERNKDGRCVKPDVGKCPDGSPMPRSKVCPCPEGTRRDPNSGQCKPLLTPEVACKLKGWIWRSNECHKPDDPKGNCAEAGGKWTGRTCVMPPTPAEACAKRGGKWDGKTCVLAPSPADTCKKNGGVWNGKTCKMPPSPAETCAKRGGKWDGKTCIFGPTPAEACKKKGGVWNGKICVVIPKTCPPGTTGTPPNCKRVVLKCPSGTTGTPPACKRIEKIAPKPILKPLQLKPQTK